LGLQAKDWVASKAFDLGFGFSPDNQLPLHGLSLTLVLRLVLWWKPVTFV
jgi:hypothetical protein